ncbi:MAG TPA: adenosine deaminase [Levilinea sp.]|nr:adenosine deaminase [Levilinea sp.]
MVLSSAPDDLFTRLPKVDLHRHLEGSLRLSTLLDLARTHAIRLPPGSRMETLVQMQPGDPLTPGNFLAKFKAQRPFYCSLAAIERMAVEVVEDAAADGVRLLELRFTPTTLAQARGLAIDAVMDCVISSARRAAARCGIRLNLIASLNRHDNPALGDLVARLSLERCAEGIAALDLAGDEVNYTAQPFIPALRAAAAGGLAVTVHAGEWGGPENVRQALQELNASRIGHGVRVLEDPAVVALARELGTVFEVCITSNYQTGVVSAIEQHPIQQMIAAGLQVTINSDDPGISRIRLSDEYRLAYQRLGFSLAQLRQLTLTAVRASFLPCVERQALLHELALDWDTITQQGNAEHPGCQ